jgi:hypothetical protein
MPALPYAHTAESLLQAIAQASHATASLSAHFSQEKKLSFLQQPLRSSGHFFFSKSFSASKKPAILWEYTEPAPSGLWFNEGKSWLWMQNRSQLRPAQGSEGRVLSSMLEQMLVWFVVEPEKIQQAYTIQYIAQQDAAQCLKLIPHKKSFFSTMKVCFNKNLQTVQSLEFVEEQGDSTTLRFTESIINCPPIRAFPDGTALP